MFAAVPLGDPWYALAARGVTTYIPESASARVESAFLDRGQAEAIADTSTGGELSRYEGLCGVARPDSCPSRHRAPGASRVRGGPVTGERSHGLTMSITHDDSCCAEWGSGQAATPDGAKEFRQTAIRWGVTWPGPEAETGT
jgi:hypothetical protein